MTGPAGQWLNLPSGKKKIDIQDYQGKVLYLFCFQSWCPGCHSSGFPTLQKVMSRFKDNDDVAFVAIQTVFEVRWGASPSCPRRAPSSRRRTPDNVVTLRRLLYAGLFLLFVLHNDLWLWDDPRRVLGLPVGLTYHVGFCLVTTVLLWLLVRHAWPEGLPDADEEERP